MISVSETYTKAMIRGDVQECINIEMEYGLFGYPPELVSVGLKALDDGFDPVDFIDQYIDPTLRTEFAKTQTEPLGEDQNQGEL